jgi:Arc/MetJ-type ribon-helix-helix transcriptional regulator
MNLTLKPKLENFIQQEILAGKYASPDEATEQSSHFVNEAALNILQSKQIATMSKYAGSIEFSDDEFSAMLQALKDDK